jgi:hypothetical protein
MNSPKTLTKIVNNIAQTVIDNNLVTMFSCSLLLAYINTSKVINKNLTLSENDIHEILWLTEIIEGDKKTNMLAGIHTILTENNIHPMSVMNQICNITHAAIYKSPGKIMWENYDN